MPNVKLPWILGISASHNGAACLLRGDEVFVAVQEERLTRVKRQWIYGSKSSMAVAYCLSFAGIRPEDLSCVVLSVTGWANDVRHNLLKNPQLQVARNRLATILLPHHYAHAMSAFATSGFSESAVLVVDGVGSPLEDMFEEERKAATRRVEHGAETISLYAARGATLVPLEKHLADYGAWLTMRNEGMPWFASLGGMYSAVAVQVFNNAMEAGKVMGLAPYGSPDVPAKTFFEIEKHGFKFSRLLPAAYGHDDRWPLRKQQYENLACSVQAALEDALMHLLGRLRRLYPSDNLCYAGGVALNSVANERIIRESGFKRVHITPAAEDSGAAIGAAYYGLWRLTGQNTRRRMVHDTCGRLYSRESISLAIQNSGRRVRWVESSDTIADAVDLLCDGKMIGWFDGRSEIGPRALGQRSILCDPRRASHREILNRKVKKREAFRPFAPVILLEKAAEWFETDSTAPESPFMLRVFKFRPEKQALVPTVVHVDATGRVQTVTREANGRFYELVRRFYKKTGLPVLLNTSFNVMGEPVVETPTDAIACLLSTGLDCCVFEDRIVFKYVDW